MTTPDARALPLGRLVGRWTTEATHPAMPRVVVHGTAVVEWLVSIDDAAWRWWRHTPSFSQRFTGQFSTDGDTIAGGSQLCEDDVHWTDDLQITYRREA